VLTGVLCKILRSLSIFNRDGDAAIMSLSGYPLFILECCFQSVSADGGVGNNELVFSLSLDRTTIT
jgi:hypothetical protein